MVAFRGAKGPPFAERKATIRQTQTVSPCAFSPRDRLMSVLPFATTRSSGLSRLRRLEGEFLRPHRRIVLLALAGMFVQSLLLLPIPLLQGMVLDRLVQGPSQSADLLVLIAAALLGSA